MEPKIEQLTSKKLVGRRLEMSLVNNRTGELWRGFMTQRKEINNVVGDDLYSLQVYPAGYFEKFNPGTPFEKWAAAEVVSFEDVPGGMETMTLPGGAYAVFLHRGPASAGPATFQYIYATWLPASDYVLDDRPHFEILDARYKNEDPSSEEEIWIPVKPKA